MTGDALKRECQYEAVMHQVKRIHFAQCHLGSA